MKKNLAAGSATLLIAACVAFPASPALAEGNTGPGWGCVVPEGYSSSDDYRVGEICDGQSPDTTQCAYMAGRVKLQEAYNAEYKVFEQMYYTTACGGVAWMRYYFPDGNPGYGVYMNLIRSDVAGSGYAGENDGHAWWSQMIAVLPGECLTTDAWLYTDRGAVQLPVLEDCS